MPSGYTTLLRIGMYDSMSCPQLEKQCRIVFNNSGARASRCESQQPMVLDTSLSVGKAPYALRVFRSISERKSQTCIVSSSTIRHVSGYFLCRCCQVWNALYEGCGERGGGPQVHCLYVWFDAVLPQSTYPCESANSS